MKSMIAILAVLMPVGSLLAAGDGEPPALQNNPFSRPPSERIATAVSPGAAVPVPAPSLELHATMIGTSKRLANVGGKILARGDEIHGYVLLEIHERHAVFERDGRQTTVYVKPLQVQNND